MGSTCGLLQSMECCKQKPKEEEMVIDQINIFESFKPNEPLKIIEPMKVRDIQVDFPTFTKELFPRHIEVIKTNEKLMEFLRSLHQLWIDRQFSDFFAKFNNMIEGLSIQRNILGTGTIDQWEQLQLIICDDLDIITDLERIRKKYSTQPTILDSEYTLQQTAQFLTK